jgi:Fur family transcriptional regulator, zinc uptake regulator
MTTHTHDIEHVLDAAADECARHGTQLTALRRDVLALVLGSETPSTAYQLLDRLKEIRRNAVPPTIYRALEFLLEARLIHRVERLNAYVACVGHAHHGRPAQFLICRRCGSVTEIEDRAISDALAQASAKAGFHMQGAMVEVDGQCAACQQAEAAA